jgi:long-chain acyl-CoA synthetase
MTTLPARTRVLATLLDNGPPFIALDEAAAAEGVVHVPLPLFFTPAQRLHALQAAGADTLVTPQGVERLPFAAVPLPAGTAKITFTSGTTGAPKGVCLSAAAMDAVADGLIEAMAPLGIRRHLNALPFAVLLENIAGLLAPRRDGVDVISLPLAEVGLSGSSSFDPARLDAAVRAHAIESLILLPQMLRAWVGWLMQAGQRAPASLKLVAVGGAAVGAPLVQAAWSLSLPVAEGYGLSEAASVQTLNLPGSMHPGSVGRVLPHARLRVAADGEIEVAGSLFSGYLGDATPVPAWWPSGDLGRIDDDGFVLDDRPQEAPADHRLWPQCQPRMGGDGAAPAPGRAAGRGLRRRPAGAERRAVAHAARRRPGRGGGRRQCATARLCAHPPLDRRPRRLRRRQRPGHRQRPPAACRHPGAARRTPATRTHPRMSFHTTLLHETATARMGLLATPIIQGALQRGEVSLPSYVAFLTEAYHHVKHTVPLLQATKAALPAHHAWLRAPLDEYVDEEAGHDEWILNDIAACGGDAQAVRHGRPSHATEVMVAYAYDTIARGNPLGFFGMVHVLEGTSVSLALMAADAIQKPLGLPDAAFSYLRSHGTLDREHTAHFERLMDRIDDPADQAAVLHAARAFFRLYGDVFRGLPLPQPLPRAQAQAQVVAA